MCDRCGQPIQPGEKTETYAHSAASGPGTTGFLHTELCRKPPTQNYPSPSIPVTGARRALVRERPAGR